jgi:hypothetical protein
MEMSEIFMGRTGPDREMERPGSAGRPTDWYVPNALLVESYLEER